MGQKVHPRGLRLGIVYNWNSRWFFSNKRTFKDSLITDLKIRKALMNKLAFSSVTQIDIERAINKIILIIFAVKPGMIIGRGGKGLEEIKKFVIDNLKKGEKIKINYHPKLIPPYIKYLAANRNGEWYVTVLEDCDFPLEEPEVSEKSSKSK